MTDTAAGVLEAEGLEITEITEFDVAKVTGTGDPANGFPLLMIKAAAGGDGDSSPGGAGCGCCDACTCPPSGAKSLPDDAPAFIAAQFAAVEKTLAAWSSIDGDWGYPGDLAKRTFTAEQRRDLASRGQALADGSYPIENAEDLGNAATLAQSGHGNVAGAKRLIAKMARKLGVKNPLRKKKNAGAAKSTVATGEPAVHTVAQDDLAKTVEDAVTKATKPLIKRISALEAENKAQAGELAKVQALPQTGGPVMSAVAAIRGQRGPGTDYWLAKEAEYRRTADELNSDPAAAESYRQLARQAAEKARTGEPAP